MLECCRDLRRTSQEIGETTFITHVVFGFAIQKRAWGGSMAISPKPTSGQRRSPQSSVASAPPRLRQNPQSRPLSIAKHFPTYRYESASVSDSAIYHSSRPHRN